VKAELPDKEARAAEERPAVVAQRAPGAVKVRLRGAKPCSSRPATTRIPESTQTTRIRP
jgi:hypothetical protein